MGLRVSVASKRLRGTERPLVWAKIGQDFYPEGGVPPHSGMNLKRKELREWHPGSV
jgi:hypothetical protein